MPCSELSSLIRRQLVLARRSKDVVNVVRGLRWETRTTRLLSSHADMLSAFIEHLGLCPPLHLTPHHDWIVVDVHAMQSVFRVSPRDPRLEFALFVLVITVRTSAPPSATSASLSSCPLSFPVLRRRSHEGVVHGDGLIKELRTVRALNGGLSLFLCRIFDESVALSCTDVVSPNPIKVVQN